MSLDLFEWYLLVAVSLAGISLSYILFRYSVYHGTVRRLIHQYKLDPGNTYYHVNSYKIIKIYSFERENLRIITHTNALIPKYSIIKLDKKIPYSSFRSIDIGQATFTIHSSDTTALDLFSSRWNGSVATTNDSAWRFFFTSSKTAEKLIGEFDKRNIPVRKVFTGLRRGLQFAGLTAGLLLVVMAGIFVFTNM